MASSIIKHNAFLYRKSVGVGKTFTVSPVEAGDLFFFARNGNAVAMISDIGGFELLAGSGVSGVFSDGAITITRSSSYTGLLTVLSKAPVTISS